MPSTGPSYWILKCCLLRTLTGLPPPFLSARVWYIFCLLSGINPGSHCSPCINSRWERINKMSRCGTNRLLKRADPVRCTRGTRAAGAAGNFNYVKVAATSNAALNMWWYTKKKSSLQFHVFFLLQMPWCCDTHCCEYAVGFRHLNQDVGISRRSEQADREDEMWSNACEPRQPA